MGARKISDKSHGTSTTWAKGGGSEVAMALDGGLRPMEVVRIGRMLCHWEEEMDVSGDNLQNRVTPRTLKVGSSMLHPRHPTTASSGKLLKMITSKCSIL